MTMGEMGSGIVLVRGQSGRRVPRIYCMLCLKPVGPDARVIWNSDLEGVAIPAVMACSQACEEVSITSTPGVRRWGHMLLAEYLINLQIGAGLVTQREVNEIADQFKNERKGANDAETQ